jgi:ketosteroid isomerase-like protein
VSQENVEVIRQSLAAYQRDDLDSWLATIDPAIEWQALAIDRAAEGRESVYRGHEGMLRLWHFLRIKFDVTWDSEAQELRDVGDDRVALLGGFRIRGPSSGIVFDSPVGYIFTMRAGKIVRAIDYLSHEEARKAVGLEE